MLWFGNVSFADNIPLPVLFASGCQGADVLSLRLFRKMSDPKIAKFNKTFTTHFLTADLLLLPNHLIFLLK